MFLHVFFILERIDITKIYMLYMLYINMDLKYERNLFYSRYDECCSLAKLHLLRCGCIPKPKKEKPHRAICAEQFSETGPWRTFVLLYNSRRFAKASYIVSRACERFRLSERFSASSIFWSTLSGQAINNVNQKGHRAS